MYVPGHLNSVADALSRLSSHVPVPVAPQNAPLPSLPEGLMLDGVSAAGGGESLFISLLRLLPKVVTGQRMPKTELELQVLLVDDLLNHADVYKLKLNHESRR